MIITRFLNLLFPIHCKICLKDGQYICSACLQNFSGVTQVQRCHVCDREVRYGLVHQDCQQESYLDGVLYVCLYSSEIKDLIYYAKYKDNYDVMKQLGEIMAQYFQNYSINPTFVTSVPLHKIKLRKRGYNQAEVLAQSFCKFTQLQYKECMKRIRNTQTQVGMRRVEREENLIDAFSCILNKIPESVLVIDDVFTTGTTLEACASLLKLNGVKNVYGFAFCKAGIKDV